MSLINNMLKELEKREARGRDIPYIALTNNNPPSRISLSQKKIFLLSIFFSILIIMLFVMFLNKKQSPTAQPMLENKNIQQISSSTTNNAIETTWLNPVSITGITLQLKENITEISFLLDHVALYRIESDGLRNQLSLIIEHSQLQSELPPVNYLNTAIQQITTQKINDDTQFTILLHPEAGIKYVNINEEDKNPELVIALEYQPKSPFLQNTSEKLVKTPAMQSLLSQQYQTALSAATNGEYQSAITILSSLLKTDPSYKDARVSLAALLIDQGQKEKAKGYVSEGLNLHPDYVPFIELKARILTMEGKIKQALALLQSASPQLDENPEYYAFIAVLYERNNNDLLATKIYKELIALNPHNGNWWFGLGLSLEKLGKTKDAMNAYTKAMTEGQLNTASATYLQNHLPSLEEDNDEKV